MRCGPHSTAIIADGQLFIMGHIESPAFVMPEADFPPGMLAGGNAVSAAAEANDSVDLSAMLRHDLQALAGGAVGRLPAAAATAHPTAPRTPFSLVLPTPTRLPHPELARGCVLDVAFGRAHAIVLVHE